MSSKEIKEQKEKEKKILKKKEKFLSPTSTLATRSKAILSYLELETEEHAALLFQQNHSLIFSTFADTVASAEVQNRKGKHLPEKDTKNIVTFCANIVAHNAADTRDPRNAQQLFSALEKMLYIESLQSIRLLALQTLLALFENTATPDKNLILSAINFLSYQAEAVTSRMPPVPIAPDKALVLCPSPTPNGKKETQEMLDLFLERIGRTPQSLTFWMETLRTLLGYLFPDICTDIGIPTATKDSGFLKGCPPDIQIVLSRHLAKWLSNEQCSAALFSNPKHFNLIIHIHKQLLYIPAVHQQAIIVGHKTILSYFILSATSKVPVALPQHRTEYQVAVMDDMANLFTMGLPDYPYPNEFVLLCNAILKSFSSCVDIFSELSPQTQKELLTTLVKIISNLLNPPAGTLHPQILDSLKSPVMDMVLCSWLRVKNIDPQMWSDFQRTLEPLLVHQDVVKQIRAKLIHLTLMIRDLCYPLSKAKTKEKEIEKEKMATGKQIKNAVSLDTKDSLEKTCVKDPNLSSLQLDVETLFWLWHAMFNIFHNVKFFKNPKAHEASMLIISEVLDLFILSEESTEFEALSQPPQTMRMNLVSVFGPILFDNCKLEDSSRTIGVSVAFGSLCKLFCRRFPLMPATLLAHFYETIRVGLSSPDKLISWTIMANAYNIFALALSGCNVMIPHFVIRAKELLLSPTPPTSVQNGKQKCLAMLSSLICFPSQFAESLNNGSSTMSAATLREMLHSVFIAVAHMMQMPSDCKAMCLFCILVSIYEEFYSWKGEKVVDLTHALLNFTSNEDPLVLRAALQCISALAMFGPQLPMELSNSVVDNLSASILSGKTPDAMQPQLFLSLAEWFVPDPNMLQLGETSQQKLFMAIEYGLVTGSIAESDAFPTVPSPTPDKKKKGFKGRLGTLRIAKNEEKERPPENEDEIPPPKKLTVRDAVEILLTHALHFRNCFPVSDSVETWCSQLGETDDGLDEEDATHWVFNNSSLISVAEVASPNAPAGPRPARMIMRNCAGKWAWDMQPLFTAKEIGLASADDSTTVPLFGSPHGNLLPPPQMEPTAMIPPPNKLQTLLGDLEGSHPELSEWIPSLTKADVVLDKFVVNVRDMQSRLSGLRDAEEAMTQIHPPHQNLGPAVPSAPVVPDGKVTTSRILMQQLGLVSPINALQDETDRLLMSDKLKRTLTVIDKAPGRESHKVGLIFVSEGQEMQNDILANKKASQLYNDFASGLGWRTDLSSHRGYLGGMDRQQCGSSALYWANSTTELIFHEVVNMPTSETDPQQVGKKRHVGNDWVHVIFSEHLRDYNPLTITSQFNEAHIIVYPLPNGLFRIHVCRNPALPIFGPLIHGMVVSKELLPGLVRQTAIITDSLISSTLKSDPKPYVCRQKIVTEATERYKLEESNLASLDAILTTTHHTDNPPASS